MVVRVDNSEFTLMNVQFANANEAGFTFGYTEIQSAGQRIVTRAIHYTHSTTEDKWADADKDADLSTYLSLSGGTMLGYLSLSEQPTQDDHAATKRYVDNHNFIVRMSYDETAGINADKSIQEISAASLENKYIRAELNGDVYVLSDISAAEGAFTKAQDDTISVIRYSNNAWTKTDYKLLPIKGGKMEGNIDMGSNHVINAQKMHIDGQNPLYLGSVVERTENGVRLTSTTNNEAAFVKPNKQSDYVPVSVGNPTAQSHAVNLRSLTQEVLADAPTADGCIANKKYVDDCVAQKVPLVTAKTGELKAYLQNGIKPDVCLVSDGGGAQCIARYTAGGHLIDNGVPSANNQLANKKYVDDKIAGLDNVSGNMQISGDLTVNGTASVIKAPSSGVDVTNKNYVDAQIASSINDVVRKNSIAIGANSSVDVPLSNGVYLITVSDNSHGGLVCVAVYPDGETISGLVNLNGWKCERRTSGNGITLTNTAPTSTNVYITSIGEGTYR